VSGAADATPGGAAPERAGAPDLDPLLRPGSVAIVGASERNYYAGNAWRRLRASGFAGPVRLVNPHRTEVFGQPCAPRLADLPEVPDLAFITLSRSVVVDVLAECAALGVRAAVVVANGFRESALPDGAELQDRLVRAARRGGIALCGPSCLGVANLPAGVDLLAGGGAGGGLAAGPIAFVTQSGGGALAFEAGLAARHLGASIVVSSGNEACLDSLDYLEYCLRDDRTAAVCAFIEGIRRPERVAEVGALARALGKPLVVTKVGRSRAAARAALSHTGAVTGSDLFNRTLLTQHGFVCVDTIEEMLDTVSYLASAPRRSWPRPRTLGIVSASGGATTILSDLAERHGLQVPQLSPERLRRLAGMLPEHLHPGNPLDISGTVQRRLPQVWSGALDCVAADPGIDALVVVSGAIRDEERDLLETLAGLPARYGKPVVLASVSPLLEILSGPAVRRLHAAEVGYAKGLEAAVRALAGVGRLAAGPAAPAPTAPTAPDPAAPAPIAPAAAGRTGPVVPEPAPATTTGWRCWTSWPPGGCWPGSGCVDRRSWCAGRPRRSPRRWRGSGHRSP
jgi:acetyltransferase